MVTDLGKGTLMADSEEEAIWWHQAEEGKDYIKQIKGSIAKSKEELKMSAREVHQKFIKGCRANIKQKELTLKVQKEFLKFCETKIKR
ncbi:hypothetical protein LCGC14_1130580 [marine sediment metagenome]|uniref:Uncharacterized protein n=1 Tax=marine sediment metagenome TaxID=412755 RepID=A0A0F9M145_9ZZZZ